MSIFTAVSLIAAMAGAGQHDTKPAEAMKGLSFIVGSWKGTQTFNAPGAPLVGTATDNAEWAVGGRFIEEHLSTTLPGKSPTDTRHMLAYDPQSEKFTAYWFNDTSSLPMILTGTLEGSKLVLLTDTQGGTKPVLRFTYDGSGTGLTLTFEMQRDGAWQELFKTVYTK